MTDLSLTERYNQQKAIVDRGQQTFVDVGIALAKIRSEKLWMAGGRFKSFEDCCEQEWGYKKSYAYAIASAAPVLARIENSAIAEKPKNEAQARPLAKLPESEQAEAWQEVVDESKAEGKKPTAAKSQEVVARRMKPAEADEWEPVDDEGEQPAPENQQTKDGDNPKPKKNGREVVSTKARTKAKSALSVVTRFVMDEAKVGDEAINPPARTLRDAINALHAGVNPR